MIVKRSWDIPLEEAPNKIDYYGLSSQGMGLSSTSLASTYMQPYESLKNLNAVLELYFHSHT